jgi:glycosyltransferase involved in cell wall biosynthesis
MGNRVKLAVIGSRGIPGRYGGFESFAEQLAEKLPSKGIEITVTCESSLKSYRGRFPGVRTIYFPVINRLRIFSEVFFDAVALAWSAAADVNVVFLLGYSACLFASLPRLAGKKVIINPDGLEWRRRKFSKTVRYLLKLMEFSAARVANYLFADSRAMQEYFSVNHRVNPVYISYPAPIVKLSEGNGKAAAMGLEAGSYFLVVARLEDENNIDLIIDGFNRCASNRRLVIVGANMKTKYVDRLMNMANGNVVFLKGIYRKELLRDIRLNCFAYLHGHEVGGTNPSLLEAMGCGNAIIALDTPFNREVAQNCAVFFKKDPDDLIRAIHFLETHGSERERMRYEARLIAGNHYGAGRTIEDYANLFRKIASGSSKLSHCME